MIALVTAMRAIDVMGEVITTPYSFVATAHALLWNNLTPVFVDIDPNTLNIDVEKAAAAITSRTVAILPVHCYGNPCDVHSIESLAQSHGLKVVYDAAHAFGVNCDCGSLLQHGDFSVLSFHATKVFNTFEGGAVISSSKEAKENIDRWKNFGFASEVEVELPGLNGKMNELQAAVGLLQLQRVDDAIADRARIDARYRAQLAIQRGIRPLAHAGQLRANFSYFPVLVTDEFPESRDELHQRLRNAGIFSRRYFYPLITDFPMYRKLPSANPVNLPVATEIASRVLCLPIYAGMSQVDQDRILSVIAQAG